MCAGLRDKSGKGNLNKAQRQHQRNKLKLFQLMLSSYIVKIEVY